MSFSRLVQNKEAHRFYRVFAFEDLMNMNGTTLLGYFSCMRMGNWLPR
jgi:hypothetical protein